MGRAMTTTHPLSGPSRAPLPTAQLLPLLLSVFISLMGFGVVLPVFPFWGRAMGAGPELVTVALGAYSAGQFIGAPLWGKLSDRFGRRPALIGSIFGIMLSYVYMAEATNVWMLGAAFGAGFIFGPAVGGIVAGDVPTIIDFERVAYVAAAISAVALVLVVWKLPESHDTARRQAVRDEGAAPRTMAVLKAKPEIWGLMLVAVLVIGSAAMMETTFAMFADDRLGWSPRDVGLCFGLIGTVSALMQALGAAPLARRFGSRTVALFGICGYALGLGLMGVTGLGDWAGAGMVIFALAVTAMGVGMFNPAYQTLVAAATDERDRGLVNGLTQGASAGGRILGPAISGSVYVGLGIAAPFLGGAALMLVALVVTMRIHLGEEP